MLKELSQYLSIFLICLLYACGTSETAPVKELQQPPQSENNYTVQKGDTLFAIAWRFDMDYRLLARANKIPYPYTIKPGDSLLLAESGGYARQGYNHKNNKTNTVRVNEKPLKQKNTKKTGIIRKKGVEKDYGQTLQTVKKADWQWPVSGKVIRHFSPSDKLSKGIDIKAKVGTPIVSSRSGEVVYAGSQLKGYGKLIIIRHDAIYLSAYAHNRKILVKEGQQVKQGQKIAELGSSGTQTPKLHFEIRRQGKPVNPLKLLVKK